MGYNSNQNQELKRTFLELQEGRCAICGDAPPDYPMLDHDHRTGGFRGVLCIRCNTAIGSFCDSPELCRRAAEYLERPRIVRFPRRLTGSEIISKTHKGRKHSKKWNGRIGEGNKGKRRSKELRRRISEAQKGKVLSEEHKRKIGKSCKGKKVSEETRRKISKAHKGMKLSEETKQKLREANLGKTSPMLGRKHSKETCFKMSKSHRGVKLSKEHRRKIGEGHRNPSLATRRKMSESQERAWKNRR